jgi:hypothetical protein
MDLPIPRWPGGPLHASAGPARASAVVRPTPGRPGHGRDADDPGAGPPQHRTGLGGAGPGRHHVVDHHDEPAGGIGAGPEREAAGHVPAPRRGAEARLVGHRPALTQEAADLGTHAAARQFTLRGTGQCGRDVVTAGPQRGGRGGHGDEQDALPPVRRRRTEQRGDGDGEHPAEVAGEVEAAPVLPPDDAPRDRPLVTGAGPHGGGDRSRDRHGRHVEPRPAPGAEGDPGGRAPRAVDGHDEVEQGGGPGESRRGEAGSDAHAPSLGGAPAPRERHPARLWTAGRRRGLWTGRQPGRAGSCTEIWSHEPRSRR